MVSEDLIYTILNFLYKKKDIPQDCSDIEIELSLDKTTAQYTYQKIVSAHYAAGHATEEDGYVVLDLQPKGIQYVENERKKFLKEIISDFDFALIKFLYRENKAVALDSFPEELKNFAPQVGKSINDGNLIKALYRLRNFIDQKNAHYYQLNNLGKAHYENEVEKKSKLFYTSTAPITNIHIKKVERFANNSPNSNNVTETKTVIKERKSIVSFIKDFSLPLIVAVIGGIVLLIIQNKWFPNDRTDKKVELSNFAKVNISSVEFYTYRFISQKEYNKKDWLYPVYAVYNPQEEDTSNHKIAVKTRVIAKDTIKNEILENTTAIKIPELFKQLKNLGYYDSANYKILQEVTIVINIKNLEIEPCIFDSAIISDLTINQYKGSHKIRVYSFTMEPSLNYAFPLVLNLPFNYKIPSKFEFKLEFYYTSTDGQSVKKVQVWFQENRFIIKEL